MADDAQDRLRQFSFQVYSKLEGAFTAGMIHLGDRLGLYRALADADGPMTSAELADATGLHERWVREWLHNQAAARLIDLDDGADADRFGMSGEARAVLASPNHPAFGMGMFHRLPQTMQALDLMPESFRTGLGHDYDSHGPEGAVGIERSFEPWNNHNLLRKVLPSMDGVVDLLRRRRPGRRRRLRRRGSGPADGGGVPREHVRRLRHLAPRARPGRGQAGRVGADERLLRRPARAADAGRRVGRPRHHLRLHPRHGTPDTGRRRDPVKALGDDGHWLLVDIRAAETLAENIEQNPMASLLYGVSVLACMSSALSEPGGEGLGTLGLPASKAQEMAEQPASPASGPSTCSTR